MSKKRTKLQLSEIPEKITQFLLDESFLLCASGKGCNSTECHEEIQDRKRIALIALLIAEQEKIRLVLDDKEASQVAKF